MICPETSYPAEENLFLNDHVALMSNCYRKLLGKKLIPENPTNEKLAKALFYAPFVVVSHNTAADPAFNYANLKALELFGFSWEEFTQLPSRLSAEPIHQFERDKLLAEVSRKGYLDSYQGIRIARSGRRFLIKNAVVWNLLDSRGCYAGQAARFEEWEFL
ncbi:MEKHLA domain-containing protein [Methyloglobulus sp.]|uniref:MEKHLA domain-containing protein n=1 Tax=Methyloglobulus sp. TaxID=2518622 RepID=UPI003988F5F6